MSIREAIFAAVQAALQAACPDVTVQRMPSGDFAPGMELGIFDGPMRRLPGEVGSVRRQITFRVDGSASDPEGGVDTHAALNDLHAKVVDALIADPQLGGLIEIIEDGDANFDVVPKADQRIMFFTQDFTVQFSAPHGRLSTP